MAEREGQRGVVTAFQLRFSARLGDLGTANVVRSDPGARAQESSTRFDPPATASGPA
jgi:hypothetical protein